MITIKTNKVAEEISNWPTTQRGPPL